MINEKSLIGKTAIIPVGWNFEGGEVTIIEEKKQNVLPTVIVEYRDGTKVEFDRQFVMRYLNNENLQDRKV